MCSEVKAMKLFVDRLEAGLAVDKRSGGNTHVTMTTD
jgi:hypothetical protein